MKYSKNDIVEWDVLNGKRQGRLDKKFGKGYYWVVTSEEDYRGVKIHEDSFMKVINEK